MTKPLPSAYDPKPGESQAHAVALPSEIVAHCVDSPCAWSAPLEGAFLGVIAALAAWSIGKAMYRAAKTRAWMRRQPKPSGGAYRSELLP